MIWYSTSNTCWPKEIEYTTNFKINYIKCASLQGDMIMSKATKISSLLDKSPPNQLTDYMYSIVFYIIAAFAPLRIFHYSVSQILYLSLHTKSLCWIKSSYLDLKKIAGNYTCTRIVLSLTVLILCLCHSVLL
jgi:hypothetical protein